MLNVEFNVELPNGRKGASLIQHSTLNIQHSKKMKANTWKTILQIAISILTAIATTLGVTSCMG